MRDLMKEDSKGPANCAQRRAKNMTLRLEPEYLRRYSSEERSQFGKETMKILYLNTIVLKLWYFSRFDPEPSSFLPPNTLSRQIHLMALASTF